MKHHVKKSLGPGVLGESTEVFENLPSHAVQRAAKHYIRLIPGEVPQYLCQNYNLSNGDLKELKK